MEEFNRENLEFHLKGKSFKGLSDKYILEAIFNIDIQNKWQPQVGDIIVGSTGNIFVISGMDRLNERLGGNRYYFGGSSCNRNGGNVLDSTFCYTANESGKYIHPLDGEQENLDHCSIREFRYVPYPHER